MAFPEVDVDGVSSVTMFPPKLTGLEPHAVKMLPLAGAMCVQVRKDVSAVMKGDAPELATGVTRGASVPVGMDVSHPHSFPDLELGDVINVHGRGAAFGESGGDVLRGEYPQSTDGVVAGAFTLFFA